MNEKKNNSKKHDIDELIAELQAKKALRENASGENVIDAKITSKRETKRPRKSSTSKKTSSSSNSIYRESKKSINKDRAAKDALQAIPTTTEYKETNPLFYILLLITAAITLYLYLLTVSAKMPDWQEKINSLNIIKAKEEQKLNKLKKSYITYKSLIHRLTAKKPFYEGVLKELSLITPKSVELRDLKINNNKIQIKGLIEKAGNRQNEIKKFILNLTTSPFFQNIKIKEMKHNRDKNLSIFELEGGLTL